jgi:RNA recognition motif-containing protein
MQKKLFVGNISWNATDEDLMQLFSQFGTVDEAIIIKDRYTGRSKGFGFVTFANAEEADAATEQLNGYELQGRALVVNEARPREDKQ